MSEMIERVARAAYFAGEGVKDSPANNAHWKIWWNADREEHEAVARAAIEAMRIPTDGMITAANCLDVINKGVLITPTPVVAWDAMIDAALKPEVQP